MKHLKKFLLMLLLPLSLQAVGFGVYVPLSFAEKSSEDYTSSYSSTYPDDYSTNTTYKESVGVGLVFDTNIHKNRLFNYRLGIELLPREIKDRNGTSCQKGCEGTKLNFVHTFGFALIKNEKLRLWAGPRINLALTHYNGGYEGGFNSEFGIAPVIGANYAVNKNISLSFDLDYRITQSSGNSGSYGNEYYDEYSGEREGATARFYLIFKLRDGFTPPPKKIAPSIEDDSL